MTYSYATAVARNRGLVSKAEQDHVSFATVAIAGPAASVDGTPSLSHDKV